MDSTQQFERTPLVQGHPLAGGLVKAGRVLGAGGFALVYAATQSRWEFPCCLKEFYPPGCQRVGWDISPNDAKSLGRFHAGLKAFQDEAETLSRFQHPGIVRVLGFFLENQSAYMVQELLEGITLAEGISMAGQMRQASVLQVAQQVGQSLLMVHAAGLVHSDLKPDNLFITKEGRYVLLDFGLTRGFLNPASQLGGSGFSTGFTPPEQYIAGNRPTPRSDVYGFAATLYALLAGMPPPDAMSRTRGCAVPALRPLNSSVTQSFERSLLQALDLDPKSRTPDIREFLHQLGLDSTPKAISYKPTPFHLKSQAKAHPRGVSALALDTRGGRLYSAGKDGSIAAWSIPDLSPIAQQQTHQRSISCLALSRDGQLLLSGSDSGQVLLNSSELAQPGLELISAESCTTSLLFQGTWIFAGFLDGSCIRLDAKGGQPYRWIAHAGPTNAICYWREQKQLISAGEDGIVRFWSLPEPNLLNQFKAHEKGIQGLALSPDGKGILTSSTDQSVRFWDLQNLNLVRDLKGQGAMVFEAHFGCRNGLVLSLAGDHQLRGILLSSARLAYASDIRNERSRALAVHPTENWVATGAGDGSVNLWEYSEDFALPILPAESEPFVKTGMVEAEEDPMLGQHLNEYKILERLGSGGMATVYLAEEFPSARQVAIKVIRPDHFHPEYQARFEREISLSLKLDHANVLKTLGWGKQGHFTYLVMELVDGYSLKDYIPEGGLSLEQAMPYLEPIVAALEYAHSLQIVHRDVKPENVMVTRDGLVKLMDFGLARDHEVKTVTKLGSAIGTAEYMAPELVLRSTDRSALTPQSDQYAFGVLVFEVLTGRRPFEWKDAAQLIAMHVSQEPPKLRSLKASIPKEVEAAVHRMLSKDADRRFPDIKTAGEALKLASLSGSASVPPGHTT